MSEASGNSAIWQAIKDQSEALKSLAESQNKLSQGLGSAAGAIEKLAQDNAKLRQIIAQGGADSDG